MEGGIPHQGVIRNIGRINVNNEGNNEQYAQNITTYQIQKQQPQQMQPSPAGINPQLHGAQQRVQPPFSFNQKPPSGIPINQRGIPVQYQQNPQQFINSSMQVESLGQETSIPNQYPLNNTPTTHPNFNYQGSNQPPPQSQESNNNGQFQRGRSGNGSFSTPQNQTLPSNYANPQLNNVIPNNANVAPEVSLTDKGTRLKLAGNLEEAIKCYNDATKINTNYAPAYYNVGVIHSEIGNFQEAIAHYLAALSRNPAYVEAYCNIGVIYKNFGNLEMAIHYYEQALNVNPNFRIARNNMAIALTDLGTKIKNEEYDLPRAMQLYKRALMFNSQYPDAYYNLGVAYVELGHWEKAITCYELALNFNPYLCEAWNNLGVIFKDNDNLEKSVECYLNTLQINPKFYQTLNNLGVVFTIQGKLEEAYKYLNMALEVNINYAEALNNLGVLCKDEGLIKEAMGCFEKCLSINPNSRNAAHNLLLSSNYMITDKSYDIHKEWASRFEECLKKIPSFQVDYVKEKVLRIGYISADFVGQSISHFFEGIFQNHDSSHFSIFCYSNIVKEDNKTQQLRSLVSQWRNILNKPADKVAEMIVNDKIDILIDLSGHRSGNRLDVMATKCAPIQITYLGYPNTTGLSTINYILVDETLEPVHLNPQQRYSEELVYLPNCFLNYFPPLLSSPSPSNLPFMVNNYITFGSFCSLSKINANVIHVWSSILSAVPNSRIVIKSKALSNSVTQQRIFELFGKNRIEITRVYLVPRNVRTSDHLKSYEMIDIALDTWPYSGFSSTAESLFMGVPVITLRGKSFAHNIERATSFCGFFRFRFFFYYKYSRDIDKGASILSQVGLQEWIADSEQDYFRIATQESQLIDRLKTIRGTLREKLLNSYLCNSKDFTLNLEKQFRQLWLRLFDNSI